MKTDKCEIYANGTIRLHLATVYSKGLAYIIAEKMVEVYAKTADRITVEIGQRIEYSMWTGKAKESIS